MVEGDVVERFVANDVCGDGLTINEYLKSFGVARAIVGDGEVGPGFYGGAALGFDFEAGGGALISHFYNDIAGILRAVVEGDFKAGIKMMLPCGRGSATGFSVFVEAEGMGAEGVA